MISEKQKRKLTVGSEASRSKSCTSGRSLPKSDRKLVLQRSRPTEHIMTDVRLSGSLSTGNLLSKKLYKIKDLLCNSAKGCEGILD